MPNRLAQSQSLYLRKHAENPIDWWPWCEAALAQAAAEDKPIFLSVGYSSCHWCTVMEGEAFSDPAIATYLNTHFVPIKVDREERPDVDSIYMQALQMLTGQGGWPLNIFLTPRDRVPFYGGTYFPIAARYNRPGFLDLLKALIHFYRNEPEQLTSIQTQIQEALTRSVQLPTDDCIRLDLDLLLAGLAANTPVIATVTPGTPNFPMMPYAHLVWQGSRFAAQATARSASQRRGDDLVLGGIYDHVGGGFHRYTVDATWTVPHFEKMLYDNGQIVEYLADLWQSGIREPAYYRAIAGTIAWLQREMTAPAGYFYAAQDADSFATAESTEPEEGAFYVWHYGELAQLLNESQFAALQAAFFVQPPGNFEGKIVLQRHHLGALSSTVEDALAQLFSVRYGAAPTAIGQFPVAVDNAAAQTQSWPGRIPAVTDTKMIVAWNSLMISGLARAGVTLPLPDALLMATKAAEFIRDRQWVEGQFYRLNYDGQVAVFAQSEDYALYIKACLDLHQATQAEQWLQTAIAIQQEFDAKLWHLELGGYYNAAPATSQELLVQERSYYDNATPAANGIAVMNLVRLSLLTEQEQYRDRAEQTLIAFSAVLQQSPTACPSLLHGLDWFLHGTSVRSTQAEIQTLMTTYQPKAVYHLAELPAGAIAMVCQSFSCWPPATDRDQLQAQLRASQGLGAPDA